MLTEPLPIHVFVRIRFADKAVQSHIERWNVEPERLETIILGYFEEMGMYSVSPANERKVYKTMIELLNHSPEIVSLVEKARQEQRRRNQSRHAAL